MKHGIGGNSRGQGGKGKLEMWNVSITQITSLPMDIIIIEAASKSCGQISDTEEYITLRLLSSQSINQSQSIVR